MRRSAIAGLVSALLAGCMVGPDYVKPKVEAPAKYMYEPQQVAETANSQWWGQFDDPVLDQLIADALANNKNVKIAAANVEQAAGVLTTTRAPLYPQVNYQGNAARQRFSQSTAIPIGSTNPANNYQVLAGATWEIDFWGRVRRLTEAAQANLLATEEARRGVILSLVATMGSSYLQLRGLDEQLEISKRTLETYRESLKLFELEIQTWPDLTDECGTGQSPVSDRRSADPADQDPDCAVGKRHLDPAREQPRSGSTGQDPFSAAVPEIPAGLPSQLLERRPDLLQSEQQLIAANAQIGAAKAQYYPSISLTAAFGVASSQLDSLFKGPAQVWNYGGSLIGPIFTGGAISGQVAQATAGQKAALLSYELAIQNAFADVENSLVSHQQLGEQILAQEALVQALREYSRFANLQYNGGYAPYIDVLQAEQQLFPAELNLATARAALLSSVVRIYQATGGGWVDIAQREADAPPTPRDASMNAPGKPDPAGASDRIEVVTEGDASVVNVYHGQGAGGAEIRAPKSGWPPRVLVRLRGFASLANFIAESPGGKLTCALPKDGTELNCQLGSARVQAVSKRADYIEVTLPAALLKDGSAPVEVHWRERA